MNEEVALGKKMEKNLRNDVEKFQNTVIKAPISSGNGFTVNRRQSLKSAASIVAEAAARKKDESQDKTTQEDYELRNLQRNKRFTASFVINQSRMDKGQSSVAQEKPVQTKPFVKKQASSFVDTQSTQTFQIPLNKVPQTTKFTVKEEPSWISVARVSSQSRVIIMFVKRELIELVTGCHSIGLLSPNQDQTLVTWLVNCNNSQ